MDRSQVFDKVIKVTSESLDVDPSSLTEQTDFKQLGADSFDLLELVTAFEDEFDASMEDEKLLTIHTIGDAVDAITQAL